MIVVGVDAHKRSHTCAAVQALTGRELGIRTVPGRAAGHEAVLVWARGLDRERVWAIEDCRHVTGPLERFLLARGERIVRIAPKLMAGVRRSARERGKSDPIDALANARAALREGLEMLPGARLDERALEIRQLSDHRERLVRQRTALINDLRWQLHDLDPEFEVPVRGFTQGNWQQRTARKLAGMPTSAQVRIARDELRRIRELTRAIDSLEHELRALVLAYRPALLQMPGCGTLTAAKAIGESAGAERFPTPAKFARITGTAPIPASSGNRTRHRLDRGGNRQLNAALHRIAITQIRTHPPARTYLARKLAEGKTRKEAIRCLKRQLVPTLWHLLQPSTPPTTPQPQSHKPRRNPPHIICNPPTP